MSRAADAFFAFWRLAVTDACRNAALCDALSSGTGDELGLPEEVAARYRGILGGMLDAAREAGAVRADITVSDAPALLAASVSAEMHRGPDDPPRRLAAIVADAPEVRGVGEGVDAQAANLSAIEATTGARNISG